MQIFCAILENFSKKDLLFVFSPYYTSALFFNPFIEMSRKKPLADVPATEKSDKERKILYSKDWDSIKATFEDFINLQESPAWYGDTEEEAKRDLLENSEDEEKEKEEEKQKENFFKMFLQFAELVKDEEKNTIPLIFRKIPEIMGKVWSIGKDRENKEQKYKFRWIDDLYNALNKHLAEAGVFITSEIIERIRAERQTRNGWVLFYTSLRMKFKFFAPDGSFVESTTEGEAMDSGDKSTNKAMSVAYKYALMQIFCIPTEEDKDPENDTFGDIAPKVNTSQTAGQVPAAPAAATATIISSEQQVKIYDLYEQLGYSKEQIPERLKSLEERYWKTFAEFTEGEVRDIIKKMEAQVLAKKEKEKGEGENTQI